MSGAVDPELADRTIDVLRRAGARFGFVFGSRATGEHRDGSDLDVAAWWGSGAPTTWDVPVPVGVDLLVLDDAPFELRGRVATTGLLLFDDDPPARVRWLATTRSMWFDELPRRLRSAAEYRQAVARGR